MSGSVGSRKIVVAGGNLFELAVKHYGDAMQWGRIARANGLWDPFLDGVVQLVIPAPNPESDTGGVLGEP